MTQSDFQRLQISFSFAHIYREYRNFSVLSLRIKVICHRGHDLGRENLKMKQQK